MERLKQYLYRVSVAFDQFLNALLGGWPDETYSGSLYRKRKQAWYWLGQYLLINALFCWQMRDHCKRAYESELERDDLPEEYQGEQQ